MSHAYRSNCRLRRLDVALVAVAVALFGPIRGSASAENGNGHWAFKPIARPAVPMVKNSDWPRTPIDNFILSRLEQDGITQSSEADPATVFRRVTLDLTGLPPTFEEAQEFLADPSREAYERVVDRLLASPHFGERWARHWLDEARYADSAGYESDTKREIWKYRDWVIKALNEDKAYDKFLIEQLAGDLMTPTSAERLVATGFNCNALKQANDLEEAMVDRVSTFGTVYLGLTIGCARCHDHKFDPISQTEFRQLYAFFNQADDVEYDFSPPEKVAQRQALKQQVSQLKRELATYQNGPDQDPLVWAARLSIEELASLSGDIRNAIGMLSKDRTEEQQAKVLAAHAHAIAHFRQDLKRCVDDWADQLSDADRRALQPSAQAYIATSLEQRREDIPSPLLNEYWKHNPGFQKRTQLITELEGRIPQGERTLVMRQRTDDPKTYDRSDGTSRRQVHPGVPRILPALHVDGRTPNRLDLARWAASRDNPLTARVVVNRIWQRYFGAGIVETSDNFGVQASPPSHPELLDWLAAELMDHGWSLKHIHRLIVNSSTYLQSSRSRPELQDIDPENRLLARQNRLRLEAEIIRDAALASSGLLDPKVGGPSVFPYQPATVMAGRADGIQWTMSEGIDRYRRGMYIHFWRLTPHPFFRLFDAPDATESCTRRPRSNTPLQALVLLNDPWFMEVAVAMARRTLTHMPDQGDEQRLDWMFRVCLCRQPSPQEQQVLIALLRGQQQSFEQSPERAIVTAGEGTNKGEIIRQAAWTSVARAVLNLDEFVTRE